MTVKAENGLSFPTRLLEVTDQHVVAMGDFVLKHSMRCDLEIAVPPRGGKTMASRSEFAGTVHEVVFAEGAIRLIFQVASFPDDLRRMAEEYGMRKTHSAYVTV